MVDTSVLVRYCEQHRILFECAAPLYRRCTFRIGGPADLLIQPAGEEEIRGVVRCAKQNGIPLLVLGRGSNVLFSDAGYRGAVLLLGERFSAVRPEGEGRLVCESGVSLRVLCETALRLSLTGLEFAYGIPGTLGGAIYMNAGAYGGEMKDVLRGTRHLEPDGTPEQLEGEAMGLAYRTSAYAGTDRIITGALIELQPGDPGRIRAQMNDYMRRRREKQPLEFPSAGSTFRRPAGAYASALIDGCGLKGLRVGGAAVSEKHAGFIVNDANATGADVRALIALVQQKVREQTGFELECEVRIIG